ncbi:MAG: flagellar motor switch protein FliG, partial [Spirochaetia bacterium]|nr:flagellar motor switch protein FliG [Spirochaetia bacterium]
MPRLKKAAAIKKLSGKEKAAIFLLALGCEPSAQVFGHLNAQDVEILSYQIASTEKVDSNTLSQVLYEFRELATARNYIATGGVDYARKLLSKAFGEKRADEIIQKISVFLHKKPFEFVKRVQSDRLVSFLKFEQPQTIALVLAYLEPEAASRILSALPRSIQSDVARRIAVMDRTSPEMLRNVEKVLEKKLALFDLSGYKEAGGIESMMNILNRMDRKTGADILSDIRRSNTKLSEELASQILVFDDLVKIDDEILCSVLAGVSSDDIAKA